MTMPTIRHRMRPWVPLTVLVVIVVVLAAAAPAGATRSVAAQRSTAARVAGGDRDLIAQINTAQERLRNRESELQVNAATAEAAARDATAARSQLDAAIARTRAVLAGVNADIRAQLAGERSRRSHLAS